MDYQIQPEYRKHGKIDGDLSSVPELLGGSDLALFRLNRETGSLRNRIQRYQRRLLKEGMLADGRFAITLKDAGNGYVHVGRIIEAAKGRVPSLHRRYTYCLERYRENMEKLEASIEKM